ncbi:hypothetical protein [Pararobbsia alpina]|uniref:hypothetical protein n=1 Tax=Pararobbsia alpina TaxID=621374 RepID=UPI001582C083|nr:hypothetical protein [Pararobbsia alpina]
MNAIAVKGKARVRLSPAGERDRRVGRNDSNAIATGNMTLSRWIHRITPFLAVESALSSGTSKYLGREC